VWVDGKVCGKRHAKAGLPNLEWVGSLTDRSRVCADRQPFPHGREGMRRPANSLLGPIIARNGPDGQRRFQSVARSPAAALDTAAIPDCFAPSKHAQKSTRFSPTCCHPPWDATCRSGIGARHASRPNKGASWRTLFAADPPRLGVRNDNRARQAAAEPAAVASRASAGEPAGERARLSGAPSRSLLLPLRIRPPNKSASSPQHHVPPR